MPGAPHRANSRSMPGRWASLVKTTGIPAARAAVVILVPILRPSVTGVGVSPLHFGVIIVVNLAIGFITPPVGVNLFVASGVAKAKLENIAAQALPMIALMILVLLVCTYIPEVPLILVGGSH